MAKKGKSLPTCKLCKTNVPRLDRCHVYPRSFSREMAGPENLLVSIVGNPQPRAGFANGGVYDDNIVCPTCEDRFQPADDHAIEFRRAVLALRPPFTFPYPGENKLLAFKGSPELLHTFAMQTLLRSYLSDRPEHGQVKDPAIAAETASYLMRGQSTLGSGRQVAYSFDRTALGIVMIAPMYGEILSLPIYELTLPNMTITVAASARGLPPGFSNIALCPGSQVVVWRPRRMQASRMDQFAEMVAPTLPQVDRMFNPMKK